MNNFFQSILTFAQETTAPAVQTASETVTAAVEEGAATSPQGGAGSMFSGMWIFIPIFGIMYFLMIRPQQKKQKLIQEMLRQLKVGDKVMTTAGALGVITQVNDRTVKINFGKDNEVEYVRAAVAEIIKDEEVVEKK